MGKEERIFSLESGYSLLLYELKQVRARLDELERMHKQGSGHWLDRRKGARRGDGTGQRHSLGRRVNDPGRSADRRSGQDRRKS